MYLKKSLVRRFSLVVTEAYEVVDTSDDDSTVITSTDPDFTSSTEVTTDSTTSSSGTTDVTSPGGDDDEDTGNKWVLPLIISLGCLLLIVAIAGLVVIYRKWKCFGLPLPCIQRKIRLAQPIKKLANSVRSSISSTFSSSLGSIRGGDNNKQFKKYAVRLDQKVKGESNVVGTFDGSDLDWIKGKDFSAEFEAMKRADLKEIPVTAALKVENVLRNRFSNVLPYDRTRVVLRADGASGNDYVNASYISGHRKEKEFICTQGPLRHTVADFWRMCWETRAVAIVMLTKCYENNLEKCYPYWPSSNTGSSTFADIKVTLEKKTTWKLQSCQDQDPESITQKDHLWQVSELRMEKEGDSRFHSIVHIVLLSWPDFGVVDPPSSLVSFVRNVREAVQSFENNNENEKESGPIVVHCSAGVGRSGVFIAVDRLIQQLGALTKQEDNPPITTVNKTVNIFQTVAQMRRERMGMVQNLQQYTLIYKCLQDLVSKRDDQHQCEEPTMVSNDTIQGSDWGLIYPEANNS